MARLLERLHAYMEASRQATSPALAGMQQLLGDQQLMGALLSLEASDWEGVLVGGGQASLQQLV